MMPTSRGSSFIHAIVITHLALGVMWAKSGLQKIVAGEFERGLAGTLRFFASKNPSAAVTSYLDTLAAGPAAQLAVAIQYGEVAVGAACLFGAATLVAFKFSRPASRAAAAVMTVAMLGGAMLAGAFYLSAGWTSASTHSLNGLLFWMHGALAYAWLMQAVASRERADS